MKDAIAANVAPDSFLSLDRNDEIVKVTSLGMLLASACSARLVMENQV